MLHVIIHFVLGIPLCTAYNPATHVTTQMLMLSILLTLCTYGGAMFPYCSRHHILHHHLENR